MEWPQRLKCQLVRGRTDGGTQMLQVDNLLQLTIPFQQVLSGVTAHAAGRVDVFQRLSTGTRTSLSARVLQHLPQRVRLLQVAYVTSVVAALVDRAPLTAVGKLRYRGVVSHDTETHFV